MKNFIKEFKLTIFVLFCCLAPLIVAFLPTIIYLITGNGYWFLLYIITISLGAVLATKMWDGDFMLRM